MACRAPRGDRVQQTYYEDISEDDSFFDLIDDMERLRSQDERIADFELDYLDNITLGHVDEVNNNGDWNDYDAGQMDDQNGIVLGDVIGFPAAWKRGRGGHSEKGHMVRVESFEKGTFRARTRCA